MPFFEKKPLYLPNSPSNYTVSDKPMVYSQQLIRLFDQCFCRSHNTVLLGGGDEPEYLPADSNHPHHRIVFTRDYCASALHEIAHWCVAGEARRRQRDYGYWYVPDGRNHEQQQQFERVEVKPQALEWIFSEACGLSFRISADNLACAGPTEAFKQSIITQAHQYCIEGLNARATQWVQVLSRHFGHEGVINSKRYTPGALDL